MKKWRENWVGFSSLFDEDETNLIIDLMWQEGLKQNWWSIYGSLRAVVSGMGLPIDKSHVFHGSKYVGSSVEEVQTYIYTLKRMHGEL